MILRVRSPLLVNGEGNMLQSYIAVPLQAWSGPEGFRKLGKGKAVPLQAWSGPEGFRKLGKGKAVPLQA